MYTVQGICYGYEISWMGWVVDVTGIREKCIHSCAGKTLEGRELVDLLAGRWLDKEIGREDVDYQQMSYACDREHVINS
jgi:hypothetical protein